jgi:hypothetical protein
MEEVSIRGDGTRFSTARMAPSGVVIPTVVDPSYCQLGALGGAYFDGFHRVLDYLSAGSNRTCQLADLGRDGPGR